MLLKICLYLENVMFTFAWVKHDSANMVSKKTYCAKLIGINTIFIEICNKYVANEQFT